MAEPRTAPTPTDPRRYIGSIEHETRRADAVVLVEMFERLTGEPPVMWGPSIIGFGRYHYRYDTGHEGDSFITGFAPRTARQVIYVMPGYLDLNEPLSRLGKHRLGKACLYVNKLDDIDIDVLEEIVEFGIAHVREHYEIG